MDQVVPMAFGALLVLACQDRRWAQIIVAVMCGLAAAARLIDGDLLMAAVNATGLIWLWMPAREMDCL